MVRSLPTSRVVGPAVLRLPLRPRGVIQPALPAPAVTTAQPCLPGGAGVTDNERPCAEVRVR